MLKIISSKNEIEIYNLSKKERTAFEKSLATPTGNFLDCNFDEAMINAENISIFGEVYAYLIRTSREEELEKLNSNMFSMLDNSPHFFVLVGNGADFNNKCEEVLEDKSLKNIKLQKIVEKPVFDFPVDLVTALQKHDKKNSWNLLLTELNKKDAEPIHGSCIFAYKSLLVYMNNQKQNNPNSGVKDFSWNSAKRNAVTGKRERTEVIDKYFNLVLNYHKARNGELDLKTQLEKWVLEN
jgi:hypothetical protein